MHEFVIPVVVGVAVGLAWMAIWFAALRVFGVPVLMRTAEERASRKQRILEMGELRYILIFGILGNGFALGLGISIALMMTHSHDSGLAATVFGAVALASGCANGLRTWNGLFRAKVPFPPHYPPSK